VALLKNDELNVFENNFHSFKTLIQCNINGLY